MKLLAPDERRRLESLARPQLQEHQRARLGRMLREVLPHNRFYAQKLHGFVSDSDLARADGPVRSLGDLAAWPFTTKADLVAGCTSDRLPANLSWPRERYVRFHQTSGTHGRPLPVLDTADDWHWWLDCWQFVLDAADVRAGDAALMAFSFGPFIGFWSAFEAAAARGCLVLPAGAMSTVARLELLRSMPPAALFCTPSYALHMCEVAREHQIDTAAMRVRSVVVAGEPGGSLPAVRSRIESAWNARVVDHAGASEVGPWGYSDAAGSGLYVLETEFIAEFLALDTGQPADDGQLAELVLTSLGRLGSPVIRYRTGDVVRPRRDHDGACRFVLLEGGVLGRTDDMLIVRGVNIFPSAVEQIVRSFPEVVEFQALVRKESEMDQLVIEIEDRLDQPRRVADELRMRLGLNVEVRCVPLLTLPRYEGKASRFRDERSG